MSLDFNNLAVQVANLLRKENCVRWDKDTIGNYMTRLEIANAIGFKLKFWIQVKEAMLENKEEICCSGGRGHYLGWPGESTKNLKTAYRQSKGWDKRVKRFLNSMTGDDDIRAEYMMTNF